MVHSLSVTIGLVQGDFHHVSCTWTIRYVPGLFSWTMDDVKVSHAQSQSTHVEHTSGYVQSVDQKELSRNSRIQRRSPDALPIP